jgi:hypothetical protein
MTCCKEGIDKDFSSIRLFHMKLNVNNLISENYKIVWALYKSSMFTNPLHLTLPLTAHSFVFYGMQSDEARKIPAVALTLFFGDCLFSLRIEEF